MRIGVIHNPRSHRNKRGVRPASLDDIQAFTPQSAEALDHAVSTLAQSPLDLLVIDGGDGTIRDVLTRAIPAFGSRLPPIAVVPNGKTNALARDLGIPARWSIDGAIAALNHAPARRKRRPVLEIDRPSLRLPIISGFIFGAGAFVRGTRLAQKAHRAGLFHSVAVGASMAAFLAGMLLGGKRSTIGVEIGLGRDNLPPEVRTRFLVLASTLERMPLRMRLFGHAREGLKVLDIDAPPPWPLFALPPILTGRDPAWLERSGYRRSTVRSMQLTGVDEFVLDGETLPGGEVVVVREGPMIEFVTA